MAQFLGFGQVGRTAAQLLFCPLARGNARARREPWQRRARALGPSRTGLDVGAVTITSLLYGPLRFGAELCYTATTDQGPRLIAAALRPWHRHNHRTAITLVQDIDWNEQILTLTT